MTVPIAGVLTAVAITTTMDGTGLSAFSALPLCPLTLLLRYFQRISWRRIGFVWGQWRHYCLAILYPAVVLGILVLISVAMRTVDVSHTHWWKAGINFGLISVSTILVAIVTEEGFFRGWLWASLEQSGQNGRGILVWTSVAFALWHWSAVFLNTGFNPPLAQVPVFMINAAVIGAIFGTLRCVSGSVLVASVSHGVWNGGAYALFGFGSKTGALGIKNTAIYGPESGLVGLALNVIFVLALWAVVRKWCDGAARPEIRA